MKITTNYFNVADMLVNLSMPQKVQKVASGAMKEALYKVFAKSKKYKVIPDEFDIAKNKNNAITVFGVKDAYTDNEDRPEWIMFGDISILLPDVLMEKIYALMNKEDYQYDITLYDIGSLWYDQFFGMNIKVLNLFILVDYFEQMNGIGNNGYSSIDSKKIFENFSENIAPLLPLQTIEEDGDMAKSLQELYNSYLEIKEEQTTNLIKMVSLYDSYTDKFKNEF